MTRQTYQGQYQLKNPAKYRGDRNNVVFRSLWERGVMRWLDLSDNVEWWASEETVIPYICKTDNAQHRYFVDFSVKFKNQPKTILIEVKPKSQCVPPKPKKGKRRETLKEEVMTWAKNISKWEAAEQWAFNHDARFQVWNEDVLSKLGILKINESKKSWR